MSLDPDLVTDMMVIATTALAFAPPQPSEMSFVHIYVHVVHGYCKQ